MNEPIIHRIAALRQFMQQQHLDAFIIPSTDPHMGEYIPAHWESRKWISGFTGSAGTIVVTSQDAGLWTDSRYFIQADAQLSGSGIKLFKEKLPDTPDIATWLHTLLYNGGTVGIDGWVFGHSDAMALQEELATHHLALKIGDDPFRQIWTNRPALPASPLRLLDESHAGMACEEKIEAIRHAIHKNHCDSILLSSLDEIAWTLNLRGTDVHCNPVFISYLLITGKQATLFVSPDKVDGEVASYLSSKGIQMAAYTEFVDRISCTHYWEGMLQLSPATNEMLYSRAIVHGHVSVAASPVPLMKAIKNETEANGFRQAMVRDGVVMVRFLKWLGGITPKGQESEISITEKLHQLRAQQDKFQGISFDTIAGYAAHAAIVHYEATPETDMPLADKGLLLLDSGAHYLDGTTDITRTIAMGPLTEEEKTDYTLVLKGHLQLQNAIFPKGTCGTQLDILARQALWKSGMNYLHGTGHGVGHFLCVHEGPHQIRMNHVATALEPGMVVTDEPGIYKADRHGIRIENTLLVVPALETEFGAFYQFEPLTLCPIDKSAIRVELMSAEEVEWFNAYHEMVYQRLHHLLTHEEDTWLRQATSPL